MGGYLLQFVDQVLTKIGECKFFSLGHVKMRGDTVQWCNFR